MSEKPQQVPSVGRVVHYVSHGSPDGAHPAGEHRAAIITQTSPDPAPGTAVVLTVFNPNGLYIGTWVPYDETGTKPGTWHWPEFVPSK
jgi:hypothetical protein